jgi:hypothetical protein
MKKTSASIWPARTQNVKQRQWKKSPLRCELNKMQSMTSEQYVDALFGAVCGCTWQLTRGPQTWQSYRDMAHEEHRQLAIANEDAKR